MIDCQPSESNVELGSASGWQSTMSLRKECDIYIRSPCKECYIYIMSTKRQALFESIARKCHKDEIGVDDFYGRVTCYLKKIKTFTLSMSDKHKKTNY